MELLRGAIEFEILMILRPESIRVMRSPRTLQTDPSLFLDPASVVHAILGPTFQASAFLQRDSNFGSTTGRTLGVLRRLSHGRDDNSPQTSSHLTPKFYPFPSSLLNSLLPSAP
jgi:hypothetical protein